MKKRAKKICDLLKKIDRRDVGEEPAHNTANGALDSGDGGHPLLVGFLTGLALRLIFEALGLIG